MHATRAIFRTLTASIARGTVGRYIHSPNKPRERSIITLKDHVYFAKATAEGPGRNGTVSTNGDAPLRLNMSFPKAAGGKGGGQNPEQLFAMGYSSCFLGALQIAAAKFNKMEIAEQARVHTLVFLGHPAEADWEGFGLRVEIEVEGCEDDEIIRAAHEFCPFSRALVHGINVKVTKVH